MMERASAFRPTPDIAEVADLSEADANLVTSMPRR